MVNIELIRGQQADALLLDDGFESQWSSLCAQCPWTTVMQSPRFAQAWFAAYRAVYEPVMALSRDCEGRLNGLLVLGRSSRGGVVVVGGHQAEYQVWIATPENGDAFPRAALPAIQRAFPSSVLRFRYLPAGTPLNWLTDEKPACRHLITPHERPLLNLTDDGAIEKCRKKKNIRSRFNKLQQMGYVGIEKLTDPADLEEIFDDVIACHDFRRLAVSGIAPFADDDRKKSFHVEMLRHGVLDVTLLRCGNEVLSAQMDMGGQSSAHLALGAYVPWVAKHAPGKIHILEYARLLRSEGRTLLDLTPGGDSYKAEFATHWDTVHTLSCFAGQRAYLKGRVAQRITDILRTVCARFDTTPTRARMHLREVVRNPVAAVLRGVRAAIRKRRPEQQLVFTCPADQLVGVQGKNTAVIKRNDVHDLLTYRPQGLLEEPRHAFLSAASKRFSDGLQSFTHAGDGRLQFSAWVATQPQEMPDVLAELATPGDVAICDIAAFAGLDAETFRALVTRTVAEAAQPRETQTVFVVASSQDRRLRAHLKTLGFVRAERSLPVVRTAPAATEKVGRVHLGASPLVAFVSIACGLAAMLSI